MATCRACDSRQCAQPNASDRPCRVCGVGLLTGPTLNNWETCGYARCVEEAVARAPRVRFCCAYHLDRASVRGRRGDSWGDDLVSIPLSEVVARALRRRDTPPVVFGRVADDAWRWVE